MDATEKLETTGIWIQLNLIFALFSGGRAFYRSTVLRGGDWKRIWIQDYGLWIPCEQAKEFLYKDGNTAASVGLWLNLMFIVAIDDFRSVPDTFRAGAVSAVPLQWLYSFTIPKKHKTQSWPTVHDKLPRLRQKRGIEGSSITSEKATHCWINSSIWSPSTKIYHIERVSAPPAAPLIWSLLSLSWLFRIYAS